MSTPPVRREDLHLPRITALDLAGRGVFPRDHSNGRLGVHVA
jgi:hypothetical protein